MNDRAVRFDDWESVPQTKVNPDFRQPYREAIVKFRHWLRQTGKAATADVFKEHLDWKKSYLPPEKYAVRLAALRWYYRKGLAQAARTRQTMARPTAVPAQVAESAAASFAAITCWT